MFSGGIGSIYKNHTTKKTPKPNMLIVRAGGPAYRIGLGGGAHQAQNKIIMIQTL